MPMSIEQLESEINSLHATLEKRGINSRRVKDIFDREFALPVNAEHKATVCTPSMLCSVAQPHMRTFWSATFGFFCTFFSCFAPAALGIYYKKSKEDGGIGLTNSAASTAGNLAVTGTILMRVAAGPMCDLWGARKTFMFLLIIGIPGMILFALCQDAITFTIGRMLIGLSLATFVTCQVWCSQFFDRKIVGTINATAGGWGNLGGGITLLTMPFIMEFFLGLTGNDIGASWRLCMIVPICMHTVACIFINGGRDLPDGSYKQLEAAGAKQKAAGTANVMALGFSNTNALIMLVTYGLCFGVELCMNNKLVPYFTRYYGMRPTIAGPLGSCFSLMNLFCRAWGGLLSDAMSKKFGIRGRIWAMWVIQTIEGLFCILMGSITVGFDGPDEPAFKETDADGNFVMPSLMGEYEQAGIKYTMNMTDGLLRPCSSDLIFSPATALVEGVETAMPLAAESLIMIRAPGETCVHNQGTLGTTMLVMIMFSCCVQMAEGLHFGIVPYISRPALGVVSGMVGAGGNAGALISGQFIVGATNLDAGFIRLGFVIMIVSSIMHFIYFPDSGGMLTPKGCGFSPQLIKEKTGQKGSDELDFAKKPPASLAA